jgi:hypothetical protein
MKFVAGRPLREGSRPEAMAHHESTGTIRKWCAPFTVGLSTLGIPIRRERNPLLNRSTVHPPTLILLKPLQ